MKKILISVLLLFSASAFAQNYYITNFQTSENPISENGRWQTFNTQSPAPTCTSNGFGGPCWWNIKTTSGYAQSAATSANTTGFDDATAIMTGNWGANQQVQIKTHQPSGGPTGNTQEIEIRLRITMGTNFIHGYEVDFASGGTALVRWDGTGPYNSGCCFTQIGSTINYIWLSHPGDVLGAKISGSNITILVNGASIGSFTDSTYTTGTPGIGIDVNSTTGTHTDFGVTQFIATDGTIRNAADCTPASVNAQLAAVNSDSDVVVVPAGTCSWGANSVTFDQTATGHVFNTVLMGQTNCFGTPASSCTDSTIINGVDGSAQFTLASGKSFRWTGFTVNVPNGVSTSGMWNIGGTSSALRMDHWHETVGTGSFGGVIGGCVFGVLDHSIIDMPNNTNASNGLKTNQGSCGGDPLQRGDFAYSQPPGFGGPNFFFMEDDTFNGQTGSTSNNAPYIEDCTAGGKYVLRHSTINGPNIQEHGTGNGGARLRSCRAMEFYQNNLVGNTLANPSFAWHYFEGGTFMDWGNNVTGFYQTYNSEHNTRNGTGFGGCASTNYTQNPTTGNPQGWGYCSSGSNNDLNFDATGYPCQDQPGRGQGDRLVNDFFPFNGTGITDQTTGVTFLSGNPVWPHQVLEPAYSWNNTFTPHGGSIWGACSTAVVQNRDYFLSNSASCSASGSCTTGVGSGTFAQIPTTCSVSTAPSAAIISSKDPGVGWFATDQTKLYVCNSTNTDFGLGSCTATSGGDGHFWCPYYTPYTYPNPLTNGAQVSPSPTITSISASSGVVGGGTAETITGTNFTTPFGTNTVAFGGTTATCTAGTTTSLTCTTPAHAAGRVDVTVTNANGSGTLSQAFDYGVTVTSVSPSTGTTSGGTPVTISGTGFVAGGIGVTFGGTAATGITVNSLSSISATTPAHAAGAVNVVVTDNNGSGTFTNGYTFGTCPQNLAIGAYTLCGENYIDIASGASVTLNYTPSSTSNGIIAWATWCFNSSCNSSTPGITATLTANVGGLTCSASPNSPLITNANGGAQGSGDFQEHYIWYCPSTPSGVTSFTMTPSSSSMSFLQLHVSEWKSGGLQASCPFVTSCFELVDAQAAAGGTQGTSASVPSNGPTTNANDLIFGVFEAPFNASQVVTQGSGYTAITKNPSGTPGMIAEAKGVVATGAQTLTATYSISTNWFGVIAPIKAAGSLTFTISGTLGVNGAGSSVNYSGTLSGSVTADGTGNYSIPGLANGTYSVAPSKIGFTFTPASQVVTVTNADRPNINFTISPSNALVVVNGNVTLRGVQINGTPAANSGPVTLPQIWINSLEYASALSAPDFTITYPNSGTGGTWTCTGLGSFGPYTAWTQSSLQQAVTDAEACRASQNKSVKIIIPHNAGVPTNIFTGSTGVALPQSAPGGVSDTSTKFIVLTSDTPLPTSLQSGTVNTSGSTVTRTAGTAFTTGTLWNNTPILINGIFYTIASVTNGNTLTTTTSIGTNTGVAYSWGERTVCSQGVQDNLAVSPEPGIRNIGCNGTNMSYSLGVTPTPVSGAFTLANGRATNTSNYNDVVSMYTIESNNNALSTAVADVNGVGPHHFAILNGEFRPVAGATLAQAPIGIGQDTETAESQLPNHIHFGYNYIHGDWQDAPVSGGVATGPATGFNSLPNQMKIDCIYCSISYSYTDQSLRPGAEGHGFSFLLSKQFKIVHNWVEGQSINSLCGGFASPITINLFTVCYDMEDRGNRYTYPYSWVLAVEAGYDPNSVYTSTGGHGTGATFHLLQTNGAPNAQGIIQMAIQAGGTGYVVNDVLTLTSVFDAGVSGGTVLVTAVGTGNAVASATIVSGTGYTVANGLATTVNSGTGTGATVNITSVSPTGGITGITLANGGTGGTYTASNVLTVVQGGASGGTIGVNSVTSGVITSINVQAGTGYSLNGPVRKNNHEYKFSNRTVLDGNIFENGDFSGGQGQSISFKANQSSVVGGGDNYWTTQQNSTVTNNIMRSNCSGMSGGFRSNPNAGAGGGVSDTVAFYYVYNNLMYNISPLGPGCELSADFSIRNASDSAGTTWTANMTRTANVATANLVPAQAHLVGMFHVGDPVLAYNCTDTSFNTNAEGFPQKTLGPLALPGTVTFGTTVLYGNNGPDVASGAGVTCTINNNQGTPNHFYANHNSNFAFSTVAQDPSSSGLASNPCVLSFNFTFINTISTWGGANAGPIGEGTRTTNCMFYPPQEEYHHNALPGRDTRVVCTGHNPAGAGGINACYSQYSGGVTTACSGGSCTIWGTDTENCSTNNPQTESCLGVLGNMSTGSFNYILGDWHQYRLCHVGDAACNNLASRYASGGTRQASDGLDMGADFTQFDPHQISIQYCASCGSFVDHQ